MTGGSRQFLKKGVGGFRGIGGRGEKGGNSGGGNSGGIRGGRGGKSAHFCFGLPRAHPTGVQNGTDLSNY